APPPLPPPPAPPPAANAGVRATVVPKDSRIIPAINEIRRTVPTSFIFISAKQLVYAEYAAPAGFIPPDDRQRSRLFVLAAGAEPAAARPAGAGARPPSAREARA